MQNMDAQTSASQAFDAAASAAVKKAFAALSEAADEAMLAIDGDQRIVLFNAAAETLFGYDAEEVLGQPLTMLLPERAQKDHGALVQSLGDSETILRRMSERRPVAARRADGSELPASITILKTTTGGDALYTAIIRDVSEGDRSEMLLRATVEGTAFARHGRFFGRAAEVLAEALGMHTVFIAEAMADRPGWNRFRGCWSGRAPGELLEYEAEGTLGGRVSPDEVLERHGEIRSLFPHDGWLGDVPAESYIAIGLSSSDGSYVGQLGLVHTSRAGLTESELASLRIFAARIGGEIERSRADHEANTLNDWRYRIFASGPFGILYRNLATGEGWGNTHCAEIFGRTFGEGESLAWDALIHPEDRRRFTRADRLLREQGVTLEQRVRILRPDGGVRWTDFHAFAGLDVDGEPTETTAFIIDRTDERLAEHRLAATSIQLDRRTAEIASSLDAFPDMRLRLAADGTCLSVWTSEPAPLFGPGAVLVGADIGDFLPGDLATRLRPAIRRTLATGQVTSRHYSHHDANGENIHFEARLAPLDDQDVMVVIRDINELKRLEDQLVHAETMQSVGRLAGGVAHDFNNVLHVIRGHAESLARHLDDPETTTRRVEAITRAVDRTTKLVDQLMNLSRPQPDNPIPTLVDVVLGGLAPALGHLAPERIDLQFDLRAEGGAVMIDDSRFENVMFNLVSNACDAMPEGGRLTITTGMDALNELRIEVTDTGEGIEASLLPRIFEAFVSTKPPGTGTGLGLARVYNTITAAGGTIAVTSTRGVGSTFAIDLPTVDASFGGLQTRHAGPAKPLQATVLVVEDEADVLQLTSEDLRGMGCDVIEAIGPQQAIAILDKGQSFDVLLTDVVMPGMAGPDLAAVVTRRRPDVGVIYMSGYAADARGPRDDIDEADILRKPFSRADLRTAVAARLGLDWSPRG